MITIVHVDGIFGVGRNSRSDQFCEDLNCLVPLNILMGLWLYAGCRFSKYREAGTRKISKQMSFAENTVTKFGVSYSRGTPPAIDLKFEEFGADESEGGGPFVN